MDDDVTLCRTIALRAARRFRGDVEEWMGPAWIGIETARRMFDPSRGAKFETHATNVAWGQMVATYRIESGKKRRGPRAARSWMPLDLDGYAHERRLVAVEEYREPVRMAEIQTDDDALQYMLARGMLKRVAADLLGITQANLSWRLGRIRRNHKQGGVLLLLE